MAITQPNANISTNVTVNRPLADLPLSEIVDHIGFAYDDKRLIEFEFLSELIIRAEAGERTNVSH
jgi:hypothetical protein